jgi:hypothetical protein
VLLLLMGRIYEITLWMTSGGTLHIPIFMIIPSGIQVILNLLPQNLRGCNVAISDGMDFRSRQLGFPYAHQVSWRFMQAFEQY